MSNTLQHRSKSHQSPSTWKEYLDLSNANLAGTSHLILMEALCSWEAREADAHWRNWVTSWFYPDAASSLSRISLTYWKNFLFFQMLFCLWGVLSQPQTGDQLWKGVYKPTTATPILLWLDTALFLSRWKCKGLAHLCGGLGQSYGGSPTVEKASL